MVVNLRNFCIGAATLTRRFRIRLLDHLSYFNCEEPRERGRGLRVVYA